MCDLNQILQGTDRNKIITPIEKSITSTRQAQTLKNEIRPTEAKIQTRPNLVHIYKSKITSIAVQKVTVQQNSIGHYDICVRSNSKAWVVRKRFKQFQDLHQQLTLNFWWKKLPPFPSKHSKLLIDHTNMDFLEVSSLNENETQRRALLDNYCKKLIRNKKFCAWPQLIIFFRSDCTTKNFQLGQCPHLTGDINCPNVAIPIPLEKGFGSGIQKEIPLEPKNILSGKDTPQNLQEVNSNKNNFS
ncbi:hypothetical protein RFI_09262 [Reticulomyxa filosa]|uniref:PX domain-containing protein n=1 Tax=Reticulomyxa filosa TaxID=46433 RepID=X6NPG0_RETFI|nr:hypothetical protein RFI_09262 [Reticulomyxa filosa]|eukprot:ETO27871.1 hypothetical protein RFI_09262 [Reticulomyxa filosa]